MITLKEISKSYIEKSDLEWIKFGCFLDVDEAVEFWQDAIKQILEEISDIHECDCEYKCCCDISNLRNNIEQVIGENK
jgi:hypothetical protein